MKADSNVDVDALPSRCCSPLLQLLAAAQHKTMAVPTAEQCMPLPHIRITACSETARPMISVGNRRMPINIRYSRDAKAFAGRTWGETQGHTTQPEIIG